MGSANELVRTWFKIQSERILDVGYTPGSTNPVLALCAILACFPNPEPSPLPPAPFNTSPFDRIRHRCVMSRVNALSCTKSTQSDRNDIHRNATQECSRALLICRLTEIKSNYRIIIIIIIIITTQRILVVSHKPFSAVMLYISIKYGNFRFDGADHCSPFQEFA